MVYDAGIVSPLRWWAASKSEASPCNDALLFKHFGIVVCSASLLQRGPTCCATDVLSISSAIPCISRNAFNGNQDSVHFPLAEAVEHLPSTLRASLLRLTLFAQSHHSAVLSVLLHCCHLRVFIKANRRIGLPLSIPVLVGVFLALISLVLPRFLTAFLVGVRR